MKRIVLDTNIIISALFWKGYPRKVYELVRTGKVIMVSCEEMMVEFIRVLGYSRFGLGPQEILPLVNNVRKHSHFVELKTKIAAIEEDPTDNPGLCIRKPRDFTRLSPEVNSGHFLFFCCGSICFH